MRRFKVVPTDPGIVPIEVIAQGGDAALHIISQLECEEADVLEDGRYVFSLRLGPGGFWCIFQRQEDGHAGLASFG